MNTAERVIPDRECFKEMLVVGGWGWRGQEEGNRGGRARHLVTVVTSEPHSCDQVTQGSQDGALHEAASLGRSGDGTLPASLQIFHLGPTCPSQVT